MIENGVEGKGQNEWRASRGKDTQGDERANLSSAHRLFVPSHQCNPVSIAHNSGRRVIGGRSTQRRHHITEPTAEGNTHQRPRPSQRTRVLSRLPTSALSNSMPLTAWYNSGQTVPKLTETH